MITLSKNEVFNLSKDKPLNKIKALVSWKKSDHNSNFEYDIDVFALPYDSKVGKTYLKNLCYPTIFGGQHNSVLNGTIVHDGDQQVEGTESLSIDLKKIPKDIDNIIIGVNIFDAHKRGNQNFSEISGEKISIIDLDNDKIIASTNSDIIENIIRETKDIPICSASLFEVGSFVRENDGWNFVPSFTIIGIGIGFYLQSKGVVNE